MKMKLKAAAAAATVLLTGLAGANSAQAQRHDEWRWRTHTTGVFWNRGQCQRALMGERDLARRDAMRYRLDDRGFNQRWRLHCVAVQQHGRVVYRLG